MYIRSLSKRKSRMLNITLKGADSLDCTKTGITLGATLTIWIK